MEKLLTSLDNITKLLEQVYSITQNQTTILLEHNEEGSAIDVLEKMFEYKSVVMSELEQVEGDFQAQYSQYRNRLEGTPLLIKLQKEVGQILKLKEEIVTIEQRNLMLMKDRRKRFMGRVDLPQNPQKVAEAYKKHARVQV